MPKTLSLRLRGDQEARLSRLARRLNKTPEEALGLLLEESLRAEELHALEFRQSPAGRVACLKGTGLTVCEVVRCWRDHQESEDSVQGYLGLSPAWCVRPSPTTELTRKRSTPSCGTRSPSRRRT